MNADVHEKESDIQCNYTQMYSILNLNTGAPKAGEKSFLINIDTDIIFHL